MDIFYLIPHDPAYMRSRAGLLTPRIKIIQIIFQALLRGKEINKIQEISIKLIHLVNLV